MTTTAEAIHSALHEALLAAVTAAVAGAVVLDADAEGDDAEIPAAGQVAVFLRDRGASGDVQGPGPYYREAVFDVEVLVIGRSAVERRTRLRRLLDAIEAALLADVSLGGLLAGMTWQTIDPQQAPVTGGADTASEIVLVTCEHLSATEL